MKVQRWTAQAVVVAIVAVGLVGCAGDSDEGSEGISKAGTGEAATEQESLGKAAAEDAGGPVELPTQTVGVIQVAGASEVIQRATNGVQQAADLLGWETKVCDGKGVAANFSTCAQSLLSQGATVMIGAAIEPTSVEQQMKDAEAQGVPWINIIGAVESHELLDGQVTPNEKEIATTAAEYLVDNLGESKTVAYDDYPPLAAIRQRSETFVSVIKANPDIEIVSKFIDDEADFSKGGNWAQQVLTKYPDLGGFYLNQSSYPQIVGEAVQAKTQGKDRPLIVGLYGISANLEQIRVGNVDAIVDVPAEATGWIAMDQAAEYFARSKPIEQDPISTYPNNYVEPKLVTKENVPASEGYVEPAYDFISFFTAKWAAEFDAS